jgi:hypothetical protein
VKSSYSMTLLEVFTALAREAGPCMFCPRQMGTGGTSPQAQVVVVHGGPRGAGELLPGVLWDRAGVSGAGAGPEGVMEKDYR